MNNNNSQETLERNLEYAFRLYATTINIGSNYDYKQVIQINLNNFSFKGREEVKTISYLQNEKGIVLTDKIIIINIYIPNLLEKCYTKGVKGLDKFEKYLYALVESDKEKLESIIREDAVMKDYIEEAALVSKEKIFGQAYDHEKADKEQEYGNGYGNGYTNGKEETKKINAVNFYNNGVPKEVICSSLQITLEQFNEYLKKS